MYLTVGSEKVLYLVEPTFIGNGRQRHTANLWEKDINK